MNRIFPATLVLALATLAVQPSAAQHSTDASQGQHRQERSGASPYAGMESRRIKALSDEQIADLETGRGMGLALAAELNGYPGPSHVIELARALGLTDTQISQAKELLKRMKAETIPIGRLILEAESELDRLFSGKRITPSAIREITTRIGEFQGNLRTAHLRYHLDVAELLSGEQAARYAELRGYAKSAH